MAIDHNSIPKDVRPLNLARTLAEEPRLIPASATARNIEGFVPNPVRDVTSPRSRPVFYPATVSDTGFVGGLGFGNPTMNCCPLPMLVSSGGIAATGFNEVPHLVGGNAGDQASDAAVEDPSSMRKAKFLCSFGGKILPRPSDGMLRYVGGQTRIVSVRREISFQELVQKMIDTSGQPVVIKYQLPDEDLDALVSVSCHEDLENMMEEHGKLIESSSDESAKLRIFLFSDSELDSSSLLKFGELLNGGQRYLDAVNGIPDGITSGITRKESVASMSSTQNSDSLISGGEAIDSSQGGDGGEPPSPRVALSASHDIATSLMHVDPNTVIYTEVPPMPLGIPAVLTGPPQKLSSSRPEIELERPLPAIVQQQQPLAYNLQQPSGMDFPPAVTYMDPHQKAINHVDYPHLSSQIVYPNPQVLGIAGSIYGHGDHRQQLNDNTVGVPPQQFIPAVQMTMASSAPHVGIKTKGFQQFVQPHPTLADPYPEENKMGARVVRLPVDQGYPTFQPQAAVPLQVGSHGWCQVPPTEHIVFFDGWLPHQQGIRPEKTPIPEDYFMCQKALPHSHSDTLVQGNRDSITSTICDSSPAIHSLHLEDNLRAQAPNRLVVSGALGEGMVEHQGVRTQPGVSGHVDHDVTASHLGTFGSAQDSETQHDKVRILQKPDNPDHPMMVFPQGMVVFPGDVKSQYGVFLHNIPQSHQKNAMQHASVPFPYQVKEEGMMSQPIGTDIPPVRIIPLQTSQSVVQESSPEYSGKIPGLAPKEYVSDACILSDQLRPIDGKMEGNHVSRSEISGSNEQRRLSVNKLEKEEVPLNRTQIAGKEMLIANAFTEPRVLPDGNHVSPIETLPTSSSDVAYFHNFQPVESSQVAQPAMLDVSGPYPHLNIGNQNAVHDEMRYGKLAFSHADSAYATDRNLPFGEWKDEVSQFQSRMLSNDVASGPLSGNSLNPLDGVLGDNQGPDSSNSLFSNQDPWTWQHETHFLPPRPNKVPTSKEAFVMMEDGVFHNSSADVNKDPNLEHVLSNKEERIKQELKAVAEGVAAMVLRSSISVDSSFSDFNEPIPEANQDREVHNNDAEAYIASKVEDVKTKLPEKTNPGLPTSEGIGRLQIIKNADLEELQELGSGTFGTVYHGKWRGSDIAIKRINDRCFSGKPSEEARMRDDFWNEAIKLADLHHPNVVAFYGVVLDGPGGSVATVTEFMVNGSLRQALQGNDRALDKHKRTLIAMDVAFGMEYLHGKNIVHFDLKSDNLLVNLRDPHRPICKVGDLGLSKVKCQTLISGGVRGTLPWMAPELLNGSSSLVSEKVDVFSFGIVMWELLTGEQPYADLHYGVIIGGIMTNTLRPTVPESCDPDWRSLMERCWSSEPSVRPSFTEIVNQLRSMAASLPTKGKAQQRPLTQS